MSGGMQTDLLLPAQKPRIFSCVEELETDDIGSGKLIKAKDV